MALHLYKEVLCKVFPHSPGSCLVDGEEALGCQGGESLPQDIQPLTNFSSHSISMAGAVEFLANGDSQDVDIGALVSNSDGTVRVQ